MRSKPINKTYPAKKAKQVIFDLVQKTLIQLQITPHDSDSFVQLEEWKDTLKQVQEIVDMAETNRGNIELDHELLATLEEPLNSSP